MNGENDEKKEIKFEVGKIEIEKDSKETVIGRKGCVNEGQTEPKVFTNNHLMTKLEEIVELNMRLMKKFDVVWERIEWLEEQAKNRIFREKKTKSQTKQSVEDIGQEIGKLFVDLFKAGG